MDVFRDLNDIFEALNVVIWLLWCCSSTVGCVQCNRLSHTTLPWLHTAFMTSFWYTY